MRVGEAGTGTAEKQWKTLRSQMAKREGSSSCPPAQRSWEREQTKPRCSWQQRRKKDRGVRGNAEPGSLNSVLQSLK